MKRFTWTTLIIVLLAGCATGGSGGPPLTPEERLNAALMATQSAYTLYVIFADKDMTEETVEKITVWRIKARELALAFEGLLYGLEAVFNVNITERLAIYRSATPPEIADALRESGRSRVFRTPALPVE